MKKSSLINSSDVHNSVSVENQIARFEYRNGKRLIFPSNHMVSSCCFSSDEEDEAHLMHIVACIAEKNGLYADDVHHAFPFILRMLKSKSVWAE